MSNQKNIVRSRASFAVIPNDLIRSHSLSAMAKVIYCYLSSRINQSDWKFYISEISSNMKESEKTVRNAIQDLISSGWVERTIIRNDKGQYSHSVFLLNHDVSSIYPKPTDGKPTDGKPTDGKLPTTNKDKTNKERKNKDNKPPNPHGEQSASASGNEDKKSSSKSKGRAVQKLVLSKEVQQYRKALLEQVKQIGKTVLVSEYLMLGNEELSIYVDVHGRISSNTRNMFLISELNEIWIKLYQYNEARKQSRYSGNTNA